MIRSEPLQLLEHLQQAALTDAPALIIVRILTIVQRITVNILILCEGEECFDRGDGFVVGRPRRQAARTVEFVPWRRRLTSVALDLCGRLLRCLSFLSFLSLLSRLLPARRRIGSR